jgi:WD40 repeat protein
MTSRIQPGKRLSIAKTLGVSLLVLAILAGILVPTHSLIQWISFKLVVHSKIAGLNGWVRSAVWDPNNGAIAIGLGGYSLEDRRGAVILLDVDGRVRWRFNTTSHVVQLLWTVKPGILIGVTKSGDIYAFNPSTGSVVWNSSINGYVFDAALDPSGSILATATGLPSPGVYVYNASNGKPLWEAHRSMETYDIDWNSDGTLLAACYTFNIPTTHGELDIYTRNGEPVQQVNESSELWKASFSPGDKYIAIAYGFPYHQLAVYNFNGSIGRRIGVSYLGGSIWNIYWVQDKLMLSIGRPGNVFVITKPSNLKERMELRALRGELVAGKPEPHTGLIALSSEWLVHYIESHGSLYIYNSRGTLVWSTDKLEGAGYTLEWSPEGKYLLVGTKKGIVYIFESGKFREASILDKSSLIVGIIVFIAVVGGLYRLYPSLFKLSYMG